MLGRLSATRRVRRRYFYSSDEFRAIIRREQLRSDRSGLSFSLITAQIRDTAHVERKVRRLEKVFADRLRATDEAGRLADRNLGIVLPYTDAAGAWKVAEDLQDSSFGITHLTCDVFEYPVPPSMYDVDDDDGVNRPLPSPVLYTQGQTPFRNVIATGVKYVVDFTGASLALLISLPVMATAAAAIKLTSPGPILFRQVREGQDGRPFSIYKFRTMHDGAEAMRDALADFSEQDGPAFKMTDDPRITPVGRVLRSTSIDELPQLWNVLRGDMSLVGPRPLPIRESLSCDAWQRRRLEAKPGLTCTWQVHGRSRVSFDEWIRMDLRYIRSRSLLLDLKLLLQTVPAVLSRRGAK